MIITPPPLVLTIDTTAPVLSSAAATTLSQTTASGSVSTDEGNGTLYWYVSTSATPPTAANLKAGTGAVAYGNQAVSSTGAQSVSSITGLTAETTYYIHYLHRDAAGNDSAIATTSAFLTWGNNLISNGGFDSDTVWTKGSGAWTISGGAAHHNNLAGNLSQSVSFVAGQTYRVIFTVSNYAGAFARARFSGGSDVDGTNRSSNGTFQQDLTAVSGNNTFNIVGTSGGGSNAYDIDNIQVFRVA